MSVAQPRLILNANEDTQLASVRMLARLMDTAFEIPGTRIKFGLDALLGLLPGLGDAISSAIGGYIVLIAAQMGVPRAVLWRMTLNLGIDALVGVVPLLGDALDVAWKANVKNAALLERALADPHAVRRSSTWMLLGVVGVVLLLIAASAVVTWLIVRAVATSA